MKRLEAATITALRELTPMKSDGVDGPGGPQRVDPAAPKTPAQGRSSEAGADGFAEFVDLSAKAAEVASLAAAVVALPEIRADNVAEIRAALRRGAYEPDPRTVALAILEFEDGLRR